MTRKIERSPHAKGAGFTLVGLRVAIAISAVLAVALPGCEKPAPATVPVRGIVTFAGGPCPVRGTIHFLPIQAAEAMPRRSGTATFDADGRFAVTSLAPQDGLLPGTYRVRIECWKRIPTQQAAGVSHLPRGYSPPDVTIAPDAIGPVELTFDIPGR